MALTRKTPLKRTAFKKKEREFLSKEVKVKRNKKIPATRSIPSLEKKLDRIFSRFIRLRDTKAWDFKYGRCISCGRIKPYDQLDCGHFHSRIHRNTRYDEDNCHCECRFCNRISADHLIAYQQNLIKKIGQERFDLLMVKAKMPCKRSAFELELLIKEYEKKVKKLEESIKT